MTRPPTYMETLVAEAVGTFLLVLIGNGAGVALVFGGVVPTAGLLITAALAHGLMLFVIVNTMGRISGGHVNPAVTIGLASIGRFSWERVPGYIVAQFVGAFGAALVLVGIFGTKLAATVAPVLSHGVNGWQGSVAEGLGAFVLVFAVVATAADTRYKLPEGWAGLVIGMGLACGIFLAGVPSGAGLNPALAISPYAVGAIFKAGLPGSEIPVYLVGPIVGGVVAAFLYRYIANMGTGPMTRTGESKRI